MINFPRWVDNPKSQSKKRLATKRLRYLVMRASVECTTKGNVSSFAEAIGMDRTTIHLYIRLGKFSAQTAASAESIFGRHLIQKEWLLDPLAIEAK